MTDPQIVSAISRFFFFTFLDESAAKGAATRALIEWRQLMSKSPTQPRYATLNMVRVLTREFTQLKEMPQAGQPIVFNDKDWVVPNFVELGTWLDFRRQAEPDEFLAVLFLRVLKLPNALVAEGLKASTGTLEYRLAHGLRRLGHLRSEARVQQ